MDENTNIGLEQETVGESTDSWDDIDLSDVEGLNEEPSEEAAADQPDAEAKEEAPATDAKTEKQDEKAETTDQGFTLKHLDKTVTVGKDEIITLAQKGMDYDRIKEKYTELSAFKSDNAEAISFLSDYAKAQGTTVSGLIKQIRIGQLVNGGLDEKTAEKQIEIADRERALSEKENAAKAEEDAKTAAEKAAEAAKTAAEKAAEAEKAKRQADFDAFISEYPTVDPKTIPQEVWEAVSKGTSLLTAYTKYENKQLKTTLEAERQNAKNRTTSVGSQKSAGAADKVDPFIAAFMSDD